MSRSRIEINPVSEELKLSAYTKVKYAIKVSSIIKPDRCSNCGAHDTEIDICGHHPDYNNPLDVTWLCRSCHMMLHARQWGWKSREIKGNTARTTINGKAVRLPTLKESPFVQAGLLKDGAIDERDYFASNPDLLADLLACLTSEEVKVSFLRYSRGMTLAAAGKVMGCTSENIRQKELIILHKLRRAYKRITKDAA